MIFEALSALADVNGSDVGAIFNFIEVGHIFLCSSYFSVLFIVHSSSRKH